MLLPILISRQTKLATWIHGGDNFGELVEENLCSPSQKSSQPFSSAPLHIFLGEFLVYETSSFCYHGLVSACYTSISNKRIRDSYQRQQRTFSQLEAMWHEPLEASHGEFVLDEMFQFLSSITSPYNSIADQVSGVLLESIEASCQT